MAFKNEVKRKRFSQISIRLSSTETITSHSNGEVTKPETINYRTFKPDKDGLFCEKIFGPVKDWECHCGKYKGIRYKGIVCDRCGVEVNLKSVRRERMGHISLCVPVVHIWYFRSLPSKIGYVLGISNKELEKIIYYETYVVINPGRFSDKYKPLSLITEEEYMEVLSQMTDAEKEMEDDNPKKFIADQGGAAVKELLKRVKVDDEIKRLRKELKEDISALRKTDNIKRLRVLEAFRSKEGAKENKPDWMVLEVIPVIPPELRPLVPLEGGRFATSDLNDLYRRVIIRNNRLKRLMDIKAPEVILRNEKRMLQEAVDALMDNSRRVTAVKAENRALKSLSDILKGKQGRFRQNLLGKRVDYSGRSVIVVGPDLKLHECGLPKDMALELFKPFVIRRLIDRDYVKTVKSAKKLIDKRTPEVWDILENVIDGHPVMLNRAPTLHRLSIQAFQPVLIEGKAITLHPLVCIAFNADFDGDQMAVHVPLSNEAQLEASILMLSSHNILSPQNGNPIIVPNQEMILGAYYLTKELSGDKGEGKIFSSAKEVIYAYDMKKIGLHARIKVRVNGKIIDTTTGRVLFNEIVPKDYGEYINELLKKKKIIEIIGKIYQRVGNKKTAQFLDDLKEIGYQYATLGGLSVNIDDIEIPDNKWKIIEEAQKRVDNIEKNKARGIISENERYNKVIDIWTHVRDDVKNSLLHNLRKSKDGFNSIFMMIDSGARGSADQVSQLAGMRGLMQKPQKSLTGQAGEIIENPILANFKEGLSILEYFISTHGARKGLADTALKTADAGYLTRRLVDVAQDVIISELDCGTLRGVETEALKEGEDVKEKLSERILGRVAVNDVVHPLTGEIIVKAGEEINEDKADTIEDSPINKVEIRSVLTCESKRGVCVNCYGRNLATGKMVEVGEAVGIIGAQSIGEPGTQLTLRTFHIGGTASKIIAQSQIHTKYEGKVKFENLKLVEYHGAAGTTYTSLSRNGEIKIFDDNNNQLTRYQVPYGSSLLVKDKEKVEKNAILYEWDPYNAVIIAENDGVVKYVDMEEGKQYELVKDDQTGHYQKTVIESKDKTKSPTIHIISTKTGKKLSEYLIPAKANLLVDDGAEVKAGVILVKIPRDSGKTRDITGGLPRVTELFEARRPSDPARIAEIEGKVEIGKLSRGSRELKIHSLDGSKIVDYKIPIGKHILVRNGDIVKAGEALTGGALDPVDILKIKGVSVVQEYLVNEIQEVYRIQGVKINDKHIEVIVKQMLQKVKITDPGDTNFLEGDVVNKILFAEENEKLKGMVVVEDPGDFKELKEGDIVSKKEVKELKAAAKKKKKDDKISVKDAVPATADAVLLGITQTSLTTDSFISAASFQETTRVLTDASIRGKIDHLLGLKENVVIGQLIPAGTGNRKFKDLIVKNENYVPPVENVVEVEEVTEAEVEA